MEPLIELRGLEPAARGVGVGEGMMICGTTVNVVGPLARWPGGFPIDLPYHFDYAGYRGNLSRQQLDDAFALAWRYWAEAVQINPRPVATRKEAKVWGTFARIDGPSNTLAWSMLANNSDSPKEQRYDAGDTWVSMNPQTPSGGIDLVRVACHEIGHVLGLDHDGGNADALLRPSYSTSIPKPRPRDIQRLIGLGYLARTTPLPPPPGGVPHPPPLIPPPGPPVFPPDAGEIVVNITNRTVKIPSGWRAI